MRNNFSIILLTLLFFSCEHELERNNPLDGLKLGEIQVDEKGSNFIVLSSTITTNSITPISDYGFCWTLEGSIPTINNPHISNGELIGVEDFEFQSTISGLELNQSYCFKLFVVTSRDTVYGDKFFSSTEWDGASPIINTNSVNLITSNSATVEGELIDLGDPIIHGNISQHGHCWSTIELPTINDDTSELGTLSSTGVFNTNMKSLDAYTLYYCRSYIVNNAGVIYGNSIQFNTTNGEPTVITGGISNISTTSITLEGEITGIGDAPITQHGHCWSTTPNPNINNTTPSTSGNATAGTLFTSSVTGLSPNTNYYYKAYATNSVGTAYGNQSTFNTSDGSPIVETLGNTFDGFNGTYVDYTLTGKVLSYGSAPITSMGIHYSQWDEEPTSGGYVSPIQNGIFTQINYFYDNTIYYYRAYAENAFGTSYGITDSFRTPEYCYISNSSTQGAPTITTSLNSTNTTVTVNITGWTGTNQVDDVYLYQNNTFITTFGNSLLFTNGQRTFTLPSGLDVSDCYTIQINDGGNGSILMVSDPFTIE